MRQLQISILLLFTFTTSLFAQTNEDTANSNPTVAFVYIGTFTTPGKITAFAVQKNGSTASVNGSPFAGPSQSIAAGSGFVFATDRTNIAVFARAPNGALHIASIISGVAHNANPKGSFVSSLNLDRTANSLYAGEVLGSDNNAFAEFANLHNGKLEFRANTDINVNFGGGLVFSENDQFAYGGGCFFLDFSIFAFHRTSTGTLIQFDPDFIFPPNPNNDIVFCPLGAAASGKGFLALAYGTGRTLNLITYRITATGGLEQISKSVIATNVPGGSLQFDPTGNLLVAGGNGIAMFKLNSNGTLTPLGHVALPSVGFFGVQWDNAGHVYAIGNGALYIFTLKNGGLVLTGSPHPVSHVDSLAVVPVM
jgi:hypothetical protein